MIGKEPPTKEGKLMTTLADVPSDDEFKNLVENASSYYDVCRQLGYQASSSGGRTAVERRIAALGLSTEHFRRPNRTQQQPRDRVPRMPRHQHFSDEELAILVAQSGNWNQLMLALGYSSHYGRAYRSVQQRVQELNLDTSHFSQSNRIVHSQSSRGLADEDVFTCPAQCSQNAVRKHFKKRTEIPYQCAICGLPPVWNGQPLTLTMDHINGNSDDNRLENLRWICPNCDRQLPTYGARNKHSYQERITSSSDDIIYYCQDCGCELSSYHIHRQHTFCYDCARKRHLDGRTTANAKKRKPIEDFPLTREELKHEIRTKSLMAVAKSVNLSDNALRKWLDKFGLPRHSRVIRKMSDEEWKSI